MCCNGYLPTGTVPTLHPRGVPFQGGREAGDKLDLGDSASPRNFGATLFQGALKVVEHGSSVERVFVIAVTSAWTWNGCSCSWSWGWYDSM